MFQKNTPIEKHLIGKSEVFVKRDDLYSHFPAPSLAKLRGIKKFVEKLEKNRIKLIGILDTRVSKSGWGLAYLCQAKNIKIICFYPRLKSQREPPFIQKMARELGAEIRGLNAGRIVVLYSQAKKIIEEQGGFMMPLGLVLNETKMEVAKIIDEKYMEFNTIVVSLGTGTICAGIVDGVEKLFGDGNKPKIIGVSCGMNITKIKKRMEKLLGYDLPKNVQLEKPNYEYYEKENIKTPFPSSKYYDKKAWKWLMENIGKLKKPILFWNIGV